ncbi:two-component regulator propeller domain-containing protein [Muribaculum intestinale]|uniref:type IX secretion system anionic LPS delivery protein PorZ n=1 Tax=Muribaculum intestinale TaxID=1796646 RepID=UPI0025ADBFBB|nr:two-component regulator propeller domain-containing protein [Muribaculum intestinale]
MYRYYLILVSLISILSVNLSAQHTVGSWELYSNYGIDRADILDTKSRVYFCGGGSLFHYDKDMDEMYSYNLGNGLSDVNVCGIYRNYDRDYTVCVYENSNIDLIYDNGNIVNLSDIKDAQYVTDKSINSVSFDDDEMYVATGFGIVRYDTKNGAVKESGIFSFPVYGVTVMGENVVISTDNGLYGISKSQRVNDFSKFVKLSDLQCDGLYGMSDDFIIAHRPSANWVNIYKIDFDNKTVGGNYPGFAMYDFARMRMFGDWFAIISRYGYVLCRLYEEDRVEYKYVELPSSLYTSFIYVGGNGSGSDNDLWYLNDDGLGHLTYTTNYIGIDNSQKLTNYTIDREPSYPFGTSVHGGPTRLAASDIGVYATYNAQSRYPAHDNYSYLMKLNIVNNGFVDDITPRKGDYTTINPNSANLLRTGHHVVVDPEDPSIVYVPTWFEGIWKFKDGKQIGKYDKTNGPFGTGYSCSVEDVAFDSNNNLWAIAHDFTRSREIVTILPANKNKSNTASYSDWITLDLPYFGTHESRDSRIVHFKHSKNKNLAMITQTYGDQNVVIYDTKGTSAVSDDNYWMVNRFTDQDGKTFGPYAVISIAEDNNGDIWLGTTCGVVVIHNLRNMLSNQDNTIERVKVPRNDGTSLADYLLDNQEVTSIAVDAGNRKWLSTVTSGVYYVSADGREIIDNFTRSNSIIPSNEVHSIVCEPNSSDVYFGTTNGVAVYHSTITPAASDFSDVYAYPNPVRPDYTGWITIKGLMDNSLVKIADSAGNVFLQTRSEGGMVMWDGCNGAGERVPTGVYYVYASQNQESNNGAVTKILVVK